MIASISYLCCITCIEEPIYGYPETLRCRRRHGPEVVDATQLRPPGGAQHRGPRELVLGSPKSLLLEVIALLSCRCEIATSDVGIEEIRRLVSASGAPARTAGTRCQSSRLQILGRVLTYTQDGDVAALMDSRRIALCCLLGSMRTKASRLPLGAGNGGALTADEWQDLRPTSREGRICRSRSFGPSRSGRWVVRTRCIDCHVKVDTSGQTRPLLGPSAVSDHKRRNAETLRGLVQTVEEGAARTLGKSLVINES